MFILVNFSDWLDEGQYCESAPALLAFLDYYSQFRIKTETKVVVSYYSISEAVPCLIRPHTLSLTLKFTVQINIGVIICITKSYVIFNKILLYNKPSSQLIKNGNLLVKC